MTPYKPEIPEQDDCQRHTWSNEYGTWYSPDAVRDILARAHEHYAKELESTLWSEASDAIVALRTDLDVAAQTLRGYEAHHRAKGTPESTEKAEVNARLAERFEATLGATTSDPWAHLDDVDKETITKLREAVAADDKGDPASDYIDDDELLDAGRLLLKILDGTT